MQARLPVQRLRCLLIVVAGWCGVAPRLARSTANNGTCDFETSVCGWWAGHGSGPTGSGPVRWKRGSRTPSTLTGATAGHGPSRHFMFMEVSGGRAGDTAYLISPRLPPQTRSMTFRYHMYGSGMGQLCVETTHLNDTAVSTSASYGPANGSSSGSWFSSDNGSTYGYGHSNGLANVTTTAVINVVAGWSATGWCRFGQQHPTQPRLWSHAAVSIPAGTVRVRFRGVRGVNYNGDMSVDSVVTGADTVVTTNQTSTTACRYENDGTCDAGTYCPFGTDLNDCAAALLAANRSDAGCSFESGSSLCGWVVADTSITTWRRSASGRGTPSVGTGAATAHTGRFFMYLEVSGGRAGLSSFLVSPRLPPATRSMTFFYHMFGRTMGALCVQHSTGSAFLSRSTWCKSGQQQKTQADPWRFSSVGERTVAPPWQQRPAQLTTTPRRPFWTGLPSATIAVRFVGTRGYGYQGDICVDTVQFSAVPHSTSAAQTGPVAAAMLRGDKCACWGGRAYVHLRSGGPPFPSLRVV
jgi:hypothetical protein